MKTAKTFTLSTVALFALVSLVACSSKTPTAKDIEGVILKETMAGFVSYSDVKVSALNCAESNKKFDCVFTAHVKGTQKSLIGTSSPFESDMKDTPIKVVLGDAGWMRVMF